MCDGQQAVPMLHGVECGHSVVWLLCMPHPVCFELHTRGAVAPKGARRGSLLPPALRSQRRLTIRRNQSELVAALVSAAPLRSDIPGTRATAATAGEEQKMKQPNKTTKGSSHYSSFLQVRRLRATRMWLHAAAAAPACMRRHPGQAQHGKPHASSSTPDDYAVLGGQPVLHGAHTVLIFLALCPCRRRRC